MISFSCEEVGHIVARFPNKESKEEKKSSKYKNKKEHKNYKDYKEKDKKSCFMAIDSDSSSDNEEMVCIAIKDELEDENDKMALISRVSKNDTWIIDNGCSHHMTGDK